MMCHANRMILFLVAAIVAISMFPAQVHAQDDLYRIAEGWAQLPEGRKWGATIGVDIDRDGNIWAFERCGGTTCEGSNLAPIIQARSVGQGLEDVRREDVQ